MSLSSGSGGGRAWSPGVAQRPTGARGTTTLETAPFGVPSGCQPAGLEENLGHNFEPTGFARVHHQFV